MLVAIGILIGLIVGGTLAVVAAGVTEKSRLGQARRLRKQILDDANREAESLRREATNHLAREMRPSGTNALAVLSHTRIRSQVFLPSVVVALSAHPRRPGCAATSARTLKCST